MSLHQRQIIREAVAALLANRTAAGDRVYETRMVPWKRLQLPAIAVYSLEEAVDSASENTAPRELRRTLQLAIEAAVQQGDNVDDAMDAIALEIERVMHADPTFGDAASDALLESTELSVGVVGEQPVGLAKLVYSVRYYTQAPEAEDTALDDLKTVDTRTSLGGVVAPADQAEDKLEGLDQQQQGA